MFECSTLVSFGTGDTSTGESAFSGVASGWLRSLLSAEMSLEEDTAFVGRTGVVEVGVVEVFAKRRNSTLQNLQEMIQLVQEIKSLEKLF
jgi:hypothetical protein